MGFTAAAVFAGVVLGLVLGGRPSNIGRRPLQLVSVLVVSVALQALAENVDIDDTLGLALVLTSYVGLSSFAVANIRLVGMPVVLVGLACNLAVITVNGGMPVDREAIIDAGVATDAEIDRLDFGAKRHLADDELLMALGDIIPVPVTSEVLSFGDLILAFGVADVIFRLLRPIGERRHRGGRGDDGEDLDLDLRDARPATLGLDLTEQRDAEAAYAGV